MKDDRAVQSVMAIGTTTPVQFGGGFSADVRRQLVLPLPPLDDAACPIRFLPEDTKRTAPFLPIDFVVSDLDRLFGPDGWSVTTIVPPHIVWCELRLKKGEKEGGPRNWCVTAAATVRLTLRDGGCFDGTGVHESFQGEGSGPNLAFALESAESIALKRAAKNLGTRFGNSLRNKDDRLGWDKYDAVVAEMERADRQDARQAPAPPPPAPPQDSGPEIPPAPDPTPPPTPASKPTDEFDAIKDLRGLKDETLRLAKRWNDRFKPEGHIPQPLRDAGWTSPQDVHRLDDGASDALRNVCRALKAGLDKEN